MSVENGKPGFEEAAAERELEELRRAIEERVAGSHGRAGWYLLLDPGGTRLAGNLQPLAARSGWRAVHLPETGTESGEHEHGEGRTVLGEGRRLEGGGYLFVGQDAGQLAETRELWTYALVWGLGATLLLAAAGGVLMGAAALRRVEAINRVAGAIVQGDLDRRIPRRGSNDEFDVLATHLNEMLARIQQLMEGMRQVSSDIAHDLRTPLGRLRQTLEKARREATTVAQYQTAVDHAIGQTDQLLQTFAALLRIAQIESGSRRARFTDVDLSEALETVVDAYAPVAEDSGHTLQASMAPNIHVQGDRELLIQAIRDDEDSGRAVGKNLHSFKMQGLVVGGVIGSLGGLMLALSAGSVPPDNYGTATTFFAYVCLLLGGAATIWGPVVGSMLFWLIMSFTENMLRQAVEDAVQTALGVALLLASFGLAAKAVSGGRPPRSGAPASSTPTR